MKESATVAALNAIEQPIATFLQENGFRKERRTFNRRTADSLIQVINFQMGQFPIGNSVIPGIRESLYGKFTVNLGIALPCVFRIERGQAERKFYQEYDCEVRSRLGSLAQPGEDVWWQIQAPAPELISELLSLIQNHGLPFLQRFSTYARILCEFESAGQLPFLNQGRSALVAAIVYHQTCDTKNATAAFSRAQEFASQNPGFSKHVQSVEAACLASIPRPQLSL